MGHRIYTSMTYIYSNAEISSRDFGDRSQLTYWILDSGANCHPVPEISGFIPGSMV